VIPPFTRKTWHGFQIEDRHGDLVCDAAGEAEMQRLLKALNPPPAVYIDALDDHDICDAMMGLPVEFFNPNPLFGHP
jgi:hypothetical protein